MFVAWKYFVIVVQVILGNVVIKALENAETELSSRYKLYTVSQEKNRLFAEVKSSTLFSYLNKMKYRS